MLEVESTDSHVQRTSLVVAIDVSDLVYYYASGNTPTGIQRVQQELAWEFLQTAEAHAWSFTVYDGAAQRWRVIPSDWLRSLIVLSRTFRGDRENWREAYGKHREKLKTFPFRQFQRGEWLLNVGASWGLPSYFVQIRHLRRRGVRCAFFMHDCIPVRFPAYFEYQHTVDYSYWLFHIRDTADLVICNSEATRNDYLEFIHPKNVDHVRVCRLDASWMTREFSSEAELAASEWLSDAGLFDENFVLVVGTIEPRKNHITLLHVWDRLRSTHPANCPKLLCVGRVGWKSDAVITQAKMLGLVDGHVFFAGALSDEILSVLYRRCLFTIYPSYYEGWGLPITESLTAGKVCVAGKSPAVVEAGAGCAVHVDERSETSVHDTVLRFLADSSALVAAEQIIRENFTARNWRSVANELLGIIGSAAAEESSSPPLSMLETNTLYLFGRPKPIADFDQADAAEMFCLGQSWHEPESWGNWTCKESVELGFRVERASADLTVFLGVLPPPGGGNVTISINGKHVRAFSNISSQKVVRLAIDTTSDEGGRGAFFPVRIRTTASRLQDMSAVNASSDSRLLGLGFTFLVCFGSTAVVERMEFLEKLVTGEIPGS
ncbi:MAG TPA: glycosyltransferase family 1 protein [Rhizomicrobium sp.]|jgi:glycosyltransferase involved in cell wall biosynthesis|nr:glycosyltransferase family 1 protein [Rhizomicrobium sp.]